MPNICIIPSGDRSGQVNLIHFYSKAGFGVFLPAHGTGGLDWKKTSTWPMLLVRSSRQPEKRNLEIHGFERTDENIFGEDRFVVTEDNGPLYPDSNINCEIIDFEKEKVPIDLFHTLRGSDDYLEKAMEFSKKYFPDAKWISSTISPYSSNPLLNLYSKNICRMMPGRYAPQLYQDANCFDFYPSGFEFDLLNVKKNDASRSGFASFNHNYQLRYPEEFKFFRKVNKKLRKHNVVIPNFGGNTIGQGADIKYSRAGIAKINYASLKERFLLFFRGAHHFALTWPTLSIREAAQLNTRLKAVIIFKENDYGGGVVWYALMASTPIITRQSYVDATDAQDIIIHDYNSIVVTNEDEAVEAALRLERDGEYLNKLVSGMQATYEKLITPEYWEKFENFVAKALKN